MGKQKAPPPPDYAAAAQAQGTANVESAQATAALNRPNQSDYNGTQSWSLKPGADPKNPQAGDWTVTTSLNATQQALKDQQDSLSGQYAGMAQGALGTIGDTMAQKFDTSGLPQNQALTNTGLTGFSAAPVSGPHSLAPSVPTNRTSLSTEGLSQYGQVDPTTENSRQRITDALYQRQTAMLDPRTQQQSSDLTSQLAAQGITEGSEAYNRARDNQARQQSDAYAAARNDAILAGGAEDTRIGNQNLNVANFDNGTRQQQLGEQGTIAGFNNGNLDTIFGQGLAASGFNNGVSNDIFNQGLASASVGNGIRAQQFGENQAMSATNNTLHQNSVAEALMQRELGMNEANALRTGAQISAPAFQAYGGAGQVQSTPIMQATTDGYNAQLGGVNAANAGAASTTSAIGTVATAAAIAF